MPQNKTYTNWTNYPRIRGRLSLPENLKSLSALLESSPVFTPRGNGRSYGDASLGVHMVSLRHYNQQIALDQELESLICPGGILLEQLLDFLIPQGYFLPVLPGTAKITIGGAIAADIHGKNHLHAGSFGSHVEEITLQAGPGNSITCSRNHNKDWFFATIGGMGLTGIILQAKIRVEKIETAFYHQHTREVHSLPEMLDAFSISPSESIHQLGWINDPNKPNRFGLFSRNKPASIQDLPYHQRDNPFKTTPFRSWNMPVYAPRIAMNPMTIRMYNLYHFKQQIKLNEKIISFHQCLFPLDKIQHWNRFYGRKGFLQFQAAFPAEGALMAIQELFNCLKTYHKTPFLTVIKAFGVTSGGWLSFPIPGFTICMDFKFSKDLPVFFESLHRITLNFNGRIYLAKDALLKREFFNIMYADAQRFTNFLLENNLKFSSALSARLQLTRT